MGTRTRRLEHAKEAGVRPTYRTAALHWVAAHTSRVVRRSSTECSALGCLAIDKKKAEWPAEAVRYVNVEKGGGGGAIVVGRV